MRYAHDPKATISVAEYLRRERQSPIRHEYYRGELFAMSGGTARHSRIAANLIRLLGAAAAGGPCSVYTSDFKVQPTEHSVYYPDVTVVCRDEKPDAVLTTMPSLVVEVTSRSSYRADHGEKATEYRAAPSLNAYLIVDQNRRRVVAHLRAPSGEWEVIEATGDDSVTLPCPKCVLSLDQIYEGIELPPLGVAEPELEEQEADI